MSNIWKFKNGSSITFSDSKEPLKGVEMNYVLIDDEEIIVDDTIEDDDDIEDDDELFEDDEDDEDDDVEVEENDSTE